MATRFGSVSAGRACVGSWQGWPAQPLPLCVAPTPRLAYNSLGGACAWRLWVAQHRLNTPPGGAEAVPNQTVP